ncbi:hypothetical protein B0H13DRAFT_2300195 [Mycena leptocephala]|nr:hypothetical protein B0H13DRAFT_2300195 [Mycena leptocephala]
MPFGRALRPPSFFALFSKYVYDEPGGIAAGSVQVVRIGASLVQAAHRSCASAPASFKVFRIGRDLVLLERSWLRAPAPASFQVFRIGGDPVLLERSWSRASAPVLFQVLRIGGDPVFRIGRDLLLLKRSWSRASAPASFRSPTPAGTLALLERVSSCVQFARIGAELVDSSRSFVLHRRGPPYCLNASAAAYGSPSALASLRDLALGRTPRQLTGRTHRHKHSAPSTRIVPSHDQRRQLRIFVLLAPVFCRAVRIDHGFRISTLFVSFYAYVNQVMRTFLTSFLSCASSCTLDLHRPRPILPSRAHRAGAVRSSASASAPNRCSHRHHLITRHAPVAPAPCCISFRFTPVAPIPYELRTRYFLRPALVAPSRPRASVVTRSALAGHISTELHARCQLLSLTFVAPFRLSCAPVAAFSSSRMYSVIVAHSLPFRAYRVIPLKSHARWKLPPQLPGRGDDLVMLTRGRGSALVTLTATGSATRSLPTSPSSRGRHVHRLTFRSPTWRLPCPRHVHVAPASYSTRTPIT